MSWWRRGLSIAGVLIVAGLSTLFVASSWLDSRRTKEVTAVEPLVNETYQWLSDKQKVKWRRAVDNMVKVAYKGGGFGPNVGSNIDLSESVQNTEVDLTIGKHVVFAGYTECNVCEHVLAKLAIWDGQHGVSNVNSVFITDLAFNNKAEKVDKSIQTVVTEIPEEDIYLSLPVDSLGFIDPALLFVENGNVVFKSVGNAIFRLNLDDVFHSFLEGKSPDAEQPLGFGEIPSQEIVLTHQDNKKTSFPKALSKGISVLYVNDRSCEICLAGADSFAEELLKFSATTLPIKLWMIFYDDPESIREMEHLQHHYPKLNTVFAENISNTPGNLQERSGSDFTGLPQVFHPLQTWGRTTRPDILIFEDGKFMYGIESVAFSWQSDSDDLDTSPTIEATLQVILESFQDKGGQDG